MRVTVRAPVGAAVAAEAAIVKVPGPLVIVDVVVVEPVLATDSVSGVVVITATAEPVLAATTTDSSVTPAPVPEPLETTIPFDIIDVEVVSATVPDGTVIVHVIGVATTACVYRPGFGNAIVADLFWLCSVNVKTFVPAIGNAPLKVGVNVTLCLALAEL